MPTRPTAAMSPPPTTSSGQCSSRLTRDHKVNPISNCIDPTIHFEARGVE